MADEPNELTIRILREIQEKLVEHDERFEQINRRSERMQQQIDYRFDGVERKLGEVIDSVTKALGTASVANVRHDGASQRFAELELELREVRDRLRRLEEKV